MENFGMTEYMILGLSLLAFCLIFSKLLKKVLLFGLRGVLGLFAVKVLNAVLAGAGIAVGINLLNGILIGALGLPALIGLYTLKLLGI